MIGDNPQSDIKGGNAAGMTTILVRTGVFIDKHGMGNCPENPAAFVVDDFEAAIKLIYKRERLPLP